jgi:transposase InsO family protein
LLENQLRSFRFEIGRIAILPQNTFDDHASTCKAVYRWVHLFYNRKRLHSGIGNLTPIEFEERLSSLTTDRTHCQ